MAQPIDWKLFGTAAENVEKQAAGWPGVPKAQDMLNRNPGSPPKATLMPYKPEGPYQASRAWPAESTPQSLHDAFNRPLTHSQHDPPNPYDQSPAGNAMAAAKGLDPAKPPPPPAPGSPGAAPINPGVSAPSPKPAAPSAGFNPFAGLTGLVSPVISAVQQALTPKIPGAAGPATPQPQAPPATPPNVTPEKVETGPDGQAGTSDDDFYKKQLAWWKDRPQAPKQQPGGGGGGFGPQAMQFIRSMFGPGGGMQFPGAWPGMMSMMMPRMMMPQWPGGGGGGMMFPQQQQQQQAPWQVSRPGLEAWLKRRPTRDDGASATPAAPSNEPGATPAAPSNEPGATPATPPPTTSMEETTGVQSPSGRQPTGSQVPGAPDGPEGGRMEDMPKPVEPEGFGFRDEGQPPPEATPAPELPEPESPATETPWPAMEEPPADYFPTDPGFTPPSSGRPDIDPDMTPAKPKQSPYFYHNPPRTSGMDRGWEDTQREEEYGPGFPREVSDSYKDQETPAAPPMSRDLPKDPVDRGFVPGRDPIPPDFQDERDFGPFGSDTMDFRPDEDRGGRRTMDFRPDEDRGGLQQYGTDPNQWNDQDWMTNLREQGERGNLA